MATVTPQPAPAPPEDASTYIDYPTLLSPTFSAPSYANTLILSTNNPTDTPLDLSTPLSRALFDAQELDTRLDTLVTQNSSALIQHTTTRSEAATRVLGGVEEGVRGLNERYERLGREVGERWAEAEGVRLGAERLVDTLRLGRAVQRVVALGRQVEGCVEAGDLVGGARVVGELRAVFEGESGKALRRVRVAESVRADVWVPAERRLLARAQAAVREFSLSGLASSTTPQPAAPSSPQSPDPPAPNNTPTYAQTTATKTRTTTALQTLALLSPNPSPHSPLLTALTSYLHAAHTSSLAALTRSLATLPTLDRSLTETAARCQNIVALEAVLASIPLPTAPDNSRESPTPGGSVGAEHSDSPTPTLLGPLLSHLETPSLPSHFWRTLASPLSSRVREILSRGGVSARTLRSNGERVKGAVRECVERGSRVPEGMGQVGSEGGGAGAGGDGRGEEGRKGLKGGWEREAAVMVGAVGGPLGR